MLEGIDSTRDRLFEQEANFSLGGAPVGLGSVPERLSNPVFQISDGERGHASMLAFCCHFAPNSRVPSWLAAGPVPSLRQGPKRATTTGGHRQEARGFTHALANEGA